MTLPALNPAGELHPGIHPATLDEIQRTFGDVNPVRRNLFSRLQRIAELSRKTGHLARLILFGSFVTSKSEPQDIDVFLVFDETFDAVQCDAETLLMLDHAAADAHFGASIFWLRRPAAFGGEQAAIEFWQRKRTAGLRGIVEIVERTS